MRCCPGLTFNGYDKFLQLLVKQALTNNKVYFRVCDAFGFLIPPIIDFAIAVVVLLAMMAFLLYRSNLEFILGYQHFC
jgi:hypothetical protein